MNRRHWLRIASASVIFPTALRAGEGTGKWSDESRQEYCGLLIEWLRENFDRRAATLKNETGNDFDLGYDYLAPTEDRRKLRMLDKFAEQRLSDSDTEEHVTAALREFESVRKRLAEAEAVASGNWVAKNREKASKEGTIFDTQVTAGNLGVILDNSRSMQPYLEKLREEISKDFMDAYFVECNGCDLSYEARSPWFFSSYLEGMNPFSAELHIPAVPQWEDAPYSRFISYTRDAPGALHCMSDMMEMDAVYWFCDFDDPVEDDVMRRIARSFMDRKVRLYVHTLDKRPPEMIQLLAEKSGGAVIRKRI
ncbi:MAG: hypothetical protein ABJQ29_16985 [Luteolibacter sp.]